MSLESQQRHTPYSVLIFELILFLFPQFIAIRLAHMYSNSFLVTSTSSLHPVTVYVVFISSLCLISWGLIKLAKSVHGGVVYKILFYIALFQGLLVSSSLVTQSWMKYPMVLLILVLYAINYSVAYHNIMLIPVLAGVGTLITSMFSLQTGIVFLVFLNNI